MAIKTLEQIKDWFRTYKKPTQVQFWDTWDSFWHKQEKIPIDVIDDLTYILNSKADISQLDLKANKAHQHQISDVDGLEGKLERLSSFTAIRKNVDTYAELLMLDVNNYRDGDGVIVERDETRDDVTTLYSLSGVEWIFTGDLAAIGGDWANRVHGHEIRDINGLQEHVDNRLIHISESDRNILDNLAYSYDLPPVQVVVSYEWATITPLDGGRVALLGTDPGYSNISLYENGVTTTIASVIGNVSLRVMSGADELVFLSATANQSYGIKVYNHTTRSVTQTSVTSGNARVMLQLSNKDVIFSTRTSSHTVISTYHNGVMTSVLVPKPITESYGLNFSTAIELPGNKVLFGSGDNKGVWVYELQLQTLTNIKTTGTYTNFISRLDGSIVLIKGYVPPNIDSGVEIYRDGIITLSTLPNYQFGLSSKIYNSDDIIICANRGTSGVYILRSDDSYTTVETGKGYTVMVPTPEGILLSYGNAIYRYYHDTISLFTIISGGVSTSFGGALLSTNELLFSFSVRKLILITRKSILSDFLNKNTLEPQVVVGAVNFAAINSDSHTHAYADIDHNHTVDTNVAIGNNVLTAGTQEYSGDYNTVVGSNNLDSTTNGDGNTVVGFQCLNKANRASLNTSIGTFCASDYVEASECVTIGNGALNSGRQLIGSKSVHIGAECSASNNPINEIVIGYKAIGAGANTAVIGNSDTIKVITDGDMYGNSFVKKDGTANQILVGDGSTIIYQEAVFSPNVVGTTSLGVGNYEHKSGRFVRVGNLITVTIYVDVTFTTMPTGQLTITIPATLRTTELCGTFVPSNVSNISRVYVYVLNANCLAFGVNSGGNMRSLLASDLDGNRFITHFQANYIAE